MDARTEVVACAMLLAAGCGAAASDACRDAACVDASIPSRDAGPIDVRPSSDAVVDSDGDASAFCARVIASVSDIDGRIPCTTDCVTSVACTPPFGIHCGFEDVPCHFGEVFCNGDERLEIYVSGLECPDAEPSFDAGDG